MSKAQEVFEKYESLTYAEKREFNALVNGQKNFAKLLNAAADFINSGKADGMTPEQVVEHIRRK